MTIGLYLVLPLLRLWVNQAHKKQVEYFLVLAFLSQFLIPQLLILLHYVAPGFTAPETLFGNFMLKFAAGYLGYFVLGWYLDTFQPKRRRLLALLGCLPGRSMKQAMTVSIMGVNEANVPSSLYSAL